MPYEIVYKGHLSSVSDDLSDFDTSGIFLPWGEEVLVSRESNLVFLSFCTVLDGSEDAVRQAIGRFLGKYPSAVGSIMCYGANPYDVRRFLIRDSRMYEQKATIEYEEPGKVVWITY